MRLISSRSLLHLEFGSLARARPAEPLITMVALEWSELAYSELQRQISCSFWREQTTSHRDRIERRVRELGLEQAWRRLIDS